VTSSYQSVLGAPLDSVAGAAGLRSPTAPVRARPKKRDALIMATATLLGLWFGLGAPAVSPVTPPGAAPSVVSVADEPLTAAPADPPAVVPVVPMDPIDPAARDEGLGNRPGQEVGRGRGGLGGGGRR